MSKKLKGKRYVFDDSEILCGLVNAYCKHCGCRSVVIRKVFFAKKVHLEKLCSLCLRHTDYLPSVELPWAFNKNFGTFKPIAKSGCKTLPLKPWPLNG